jgi:hypothetical protein
LRVEIAKANILQANNWKQLLKVSCMEHPRTSRLIAVEEDGEKNVDTVEEIVYTIQGIVCSTDLPPFLETPQ